ncbi:hypothetical protein [Paenibacillus sacheonensis]|uniref:DUF5666 domain-containing protein n=1 Tax=Paenibacillus sacheonensis TaxID=742054 RepID=A0A7X4YLZ7_9BACL|nr:hypothetical protein [Paenibacillus sacheonensis]MBM7565931.1 hypothetical protein [Paenibacillus sacheonensis]NBC68755.1 hypothetical protein [Paenibacillus sacheonensis]
MERSSIKLMAAAMIISVMLAGCGAKNDAATADNGQAAADSGQPAQTGGGNASGPQQPDRTADYFAKVVKVDGDSIVVQKSTTSPADMPSFGGGGRQGGQRPQGGEGGNSSQGDGQNAAGYGGQRGQRGGGVDGQAPGGSGGQGAGDGQAAGGTEGQTGGKQGRGRFGGGGGGFMNQMEFAADQIAVPVNADTQIVKLGRGENGMTNDAMKASDLKAGDILMVWLGPDNATAQYIRLQFNPANMSNAGNRGNAGTGNASDTGKAGNGQ